MILTLAEVKAIPAINISDTSQDDWLTELIEACGKRFESYCNQPIVQTTKTAWQFIGTGESSYKLPFTTAVTLTAGSVYERADPADTWEQLTEVYLEQIGDNVFQLFNADGFIAGYRYKCTIAVGFATIPDDVRQAAMEYVTYFYKRFGSGSSNDFITLESRAENAGGVVTSQKFIDLDKMLKPFLQPYKILV